MRVTIGSWLLLDEANEREIFPDELFSDGLADQAQQVFQRYILRVLGAAGLGLGPSQEEQEGVLYLALRVMRLSPDCLKGKQ